VDDKVTSQTQSRYNRLAPIYDLMEAILERLAFRRWRERLWSQVDGNRILEVGVGTGLEIERVEELASGGLVKLIIARPRLEARGRHDRQG
jgi:ubiquinone/menaquinone biosynthesis C-methylase UbiE